MSTHLVGAPARAADILGAGPASLVGSGTNSLSAFLSELRRESPVDVKDGIGVLAGGAAGAYFWKDHRWLGAIAGASGGRNVAGLLNPSTRQDSLVNMGVTASAIMGSLSLPKHRVLGFGLGWLVGGLAVHVTKLR